MIGRYWSIRELIGSLKSSIDNNQNGPLRRAVTFAAGVAVSPALSCISNGLRPAVLVRKFSFEFIRQIVEIFSRHALGELAEQYTASDELFL